MEPTQAAKPDWLALVAIVLTAAINLVLSLAAPGTSIVFLVGAVVFWIGFMSVRAWQDVHIFREWGLTRENLGPAALVAVAVLLAGIAALALYAHFRATLRFPLHTLFLFSFYPLWGLIQQVLALGIVLVNLERLPAWGGNKPVVVAATAVLFGVIHAYDVRLVAGTFVLELVLATMFLQFRNVWPLGVLHGWLGGLFYLWVLNRDLWIEAFGT